MVTEGERLYGVPRNLVCPLDMEVSNSHNYFQGEFSPGRNLVRIAAHLNRQAPQGDRA